MGENKFSFASCAPKSFPKREERRKKTRKRKVKPKIGMTLMSEMKKNGMGKKKKTLQVRFKQ